MPGLHCAVAICKNNAIIAKKRGLKVSFHRFPKDEKKRNLWIEQCRRKDQFNPNKSYICCNHFSPDDFEHNLKFKLMGTPSRTMLKKNAVPSRNLILEECDDYRLMKNSNNSSIPKTEIKIIEITESSE